MLAYDDIYVGAGLAAHLHAFRRRGEGGRKVLFIDPLNRHKHRHSWCFWKTRPIIADELIRKTWNCWSLSEGKQTVVCREKDIPYCLVWSDEYLSHLGAALPADWRFGEKVRQITDHCVTTSEGQYCGANIWDSRLDWSCYRPETIKQDFLECLIEMPKAVWDAREAKLMEFFPEDNGVHFIYLLPLDSKRALITPTSFTLVPQTKQRHLKRLNHYLSTRHSVSLSEAKLTHEIHGRLPMGFLRKGNDRLGVAGGEIRPSTGYAFWQHVCGIEPSRLDRSLDSLFLSLMKTKPEVMRELFLQLFDRCPAKHLIRFLQGEGKTVDRVNVVLSMPKWPMIQRGVYEFLDYCSG